MGQKSATSLHRSNLALIRHCEEGRRSNQSAAELDEVNLFIIHPDYRADARNDAYSKNYHADPHNNTQTVFRHCEESRFLRDDEAISLLRHFEEERRSNRSAAELDEVNLFIIQPDCHADARNDEFSKNYHADARNDIELKDCLFKSRRDL